MLARLSRILCRWIFAFASCLVLAFSPILIGCEGVVVPRLASSAPADEAPDALTPADPSRGTDAARPASESSSDGADEDTSDGVADGDVADGGQRFPDLEDSEIVVDRERAEVRVPARFVIASRQIEVFACHPLGPAHETVLTFRANGAQMLRALTQIGCRSSDHWSRTAPDDFLRTQGDRVLLSVRWQAGGEEREFPAEALLLEGNTGFASFVRGFSFAAPTRLVQAAEGEASVVENSDASVPDEKDPRVPRVVELTLGATQRERAVFSLLVHPTTLESNAADAAIARSRSLRPWSLPPTLNEALLEGLLDSDPGTEAVEPDGPPADQRTGTATATLVFRRVESELALLRELRRIAASRGVEDRLPLYDRLEPIAREIDALKAAYEQVGQSVERLLETPLDEIPQAAHAELAARAEMLRRVGRWLAARVQQSYFRRYLEEGRFFVQAVHADAASPSDLRVWVHNLIEGGLRYEPLLATEEVSLRAGDLQDLSVRQAMHVLELERLSDIAEARRKELEALIAELDTSEAYRRSLFEEDLVRNGIARRVLTARLDWSRSIIEGLRQWQSDNLMSGENASSEMEAAGETIRRRAFNELRVALVEERLLELREKERWARDDLESGVPQRADKARAELVEVLRERKKLQADLESAQRQLEALRAQRESESREGESRESESRG